jgi:hypothetical protein
VDFHLERGLRLNTKPEHGTLYRWAINEIDAQGQQIGHDQIPWAWTLNFTATSCVLCDSIDIGDIRSRKSSFEMKNTTPAPPDKIETVQQQVIRVQLRSGHPRDGEDFFRGTTFSMFGTDRVIKSFQLEIHPIVDPTNQESCSAWGCVSYTAEIDFRHETQDDCIVFYLFVKPETFARYGAKVAHGLVDEMILSVGSVAGFYSEWSPSISTHNVKVLTPDREEQKIAFPPGHQVEPPRLGYVGTAKLYINRRLEFRKRAPGAEEGEEMADFGTERAVPETQAPPAVDPRMLQMLGSLKRAAWFVVCLLALIFIVTLLKS